MRTALMACVLIVVVNMLFAQEPPASVAQMLQPDTVGFVQDSLKVKPDTTKKVETLDSTVVYSADLVSFTFNPRVTILEGDAKVVYKSMDLTAGRIEIRWDDDLLVASSVTDTIKLLRRDTLGVQPDSVVVKGKPKMADGTQVIVGETMTYDIKTKRGMVVEGVTDYQDGKYHGVAIKKIDSDTYNIHSGFYTTCDQEEPHYGFWASEMKLMMHDKIIARPIVLEFGPVPVMIAPFGVFPSRGGRHSGILVPTYGESSSQGRYFTGLGYYWAPNDYYDTRTWIDYYEEMGVNFGVQTRYALRYVYSGGLLATYANRRGLTSNTKEYRIDLNHAHQLSRNANLNVSASYVSSEQQTDTYEADIQRRLDKIVRSDATLSQRWPGTPYSASINLHHEKNLETGEINASMPQASFSRSQTPLLKLPEGTKPEDARFWNTIYWRYSGSGINSSASRVTTRNDGSKFKTSRDRGGIRHDLGWTSALKPFGVFSFTPNFNYNEIWLDEWLDYNLHDDGSADTVKHKNFRARRTFNLGAGLSTKLYGLFHPNLFNVSAIRHTLSPSLGFSYTPDFSDGKWDYYEIGRNIQGVERFYDRFAGNVYGGTPLRESKTLTIGVENLFEYKVASGGKESKGELFSLGMNTAHNFSADSLKWSDLSSSLRIKSLSGALGKSFSGLGLDVTARHSFYAQEDDGSGYYYTVNQPAEGGLRMLSIDLMTSLKVQGGEAASKTREDTAKAVANIDRIDPIVWNPSPLPWSAGLDFRYGLVKSNPTSVDKRIWTAVSCELKATKNWRINGNATVDMVHKEIASAAITLYRDLHCWEGRFIWNPVGLRSGYYLIINVKSANLKDVKVEKREGGGGFFGL